MSADPQQVSFLMLCVMYFFGVATSILVHVGKKYIDIHTLKRQRAVEGSIEDGKINARKLKEIHGVLYSDFKKIHYDFDITSPHRSYYSVESLYKDFGYALTGTELEEVIKQILAVDPTEIHIRYIRICVELLRLRVKG